jgi:formate dehydrogenase subunit delta
MMHDDKIVKMANDISAFYQAEPTRDAAVAGMLSHISRFWARRMREKLVEHARQPDSGLSELSRAVAQKLTAAK